MLLISFRLHFSFVSGLQWHLSWAQCSACAEEESTSESAAAVTLYGPFAGFVFCSGGFVEISLALFAESEALQADGGNMRCGVFFPLCGVCFQ